FFQAEDGIRCFHVTGVQTCALPIYRVAKGQSLITLESDKATMEIPSPSEGVVKDVTLKVGDKVSKGMPILVLEGAGEASAAPSPAPAAAQPAKTTEAPSGPAAAAGHIPAPAPAAAIAPRPGGWEPAEMGHAKPHASPS